MSENTLRLSDFDFPKTIVDSGEIQKFSSEEPFISLAVELFKEVAMVTSVNACAYRLNPDNTPRLWERNEAILGGLMVRLVKLQSAFLDQVCQNRREISDIISRCIAETVINLKYLLQGKDELFDEYIEYSLRSEKKLLNLIKDNILKRGHELPIETRMKRSIDNSFKSSNFKPEQVDETKNTPWGDTIFKRAKAVDMDFAYQGIFGLPSHFVHGNWQDLITNHLEEKDGKFSPAPDWSGIRPQPLFVLGIFVIEVNQVYLDHLLPDCEDKSKIKDMLNDILVRIRQVDNLHEQYLQKR